MLPRVAWLSMSRRAFLFVSMMLVIVASLSANQSCFFRFEKPIVSAVAVAGSGGPE